MLTSPVPVRKPKNTTSEDYVKLLVNYIENSDIRDILTLTTCALEGTHNYIEDDLLNSIGLLGLSTTYQEPVMKALRKKYTLKLGYERLICDLNGIRNASTFRRLIGGYRLDDAQRNGLQRLLTDKLDDMQRCILECRYKNNLTLKQTAEIVNFPSGEAVRLAQERILRFLRTPGFKVFYTLGVKA